MERNKKEETILTNNKLKVMKSLLALSLGLLLILPDLTGQKNTMKLYGLESGIIEYSYSGNKTGKGILYFDDYGMKSAMYTDAVEKGEKRKGWVVTFGDYQYIFDHDNPSKGLKMKNPIITWFSESSKDNVESFTESMYSKMGFSEAPVETFIGKPCKVMKGDMGKILIWNGLLMKMEMNLGSVISVQEVTSIKTNIPVDDRYFRIPDNITFNQVPGF